jgi:hypothetical protein
MAHRIIRAGLVVVMVWGLTACSVEPWVKPYERANLADPIMSFSRNPIADRYMDHVYDVREGARGASGGGGGGCGCN